MRLKGRSAAVGMAIILVAHLCSLLRDQHHHRDDQLQVKHHRDEQQHPEHYPGNTSPPPFRGPSLDVSTIDDYHHDYHGRVTVESTMTTMPPVTKPRSMSSWSSWSLSSSHLYMSRPASSSPSPSPSPSWSSNSFGVTVAAATAASATPRQHSSSSASGGGRGGNVGRGTGRGGNGSNSNNNSGGGATSSSSSGAVRSSNNNHNSVDNYEEHQYGTYPPPPTEKSTLHLRVSVRNNNLQEAPSCQHAFSQIELLNLHTTDHVLIHSIEATPEQTRWINPPLYEQQQHRSSSSSPPLVSWLPTQVHISRLPFNSLQLGPGQVAIVPVTFFPRFPPLQSMVIESSSSPSAATDHGNFCGGPPVSTNASSSYRRRRRRSGRRQYDEDQPENGVDGGGGNSDGDGTSAADVNPSVWLAADFEDWMGPQAHLLLERIERHKLYDGNDTTTTTDQKRSRQQQHQSRRQRAASQGDGDESDFVMVSMDCAEIPLGHGRDNLELINEYPPSTAAWMESGDGVESGSDADDYYGGPEPGDDDVFEVASTIVVDTSRGPVRLPITATSVRGNLYGLPDAIYFDLDNAGVPITTTSPSPSTGSPETNPGTYQTPSSSPSTSPTINVEVPLGAPTIDGDAGTKTESPPPRRTTTTTPPRGLVNSDGSGVWILDSKYTQSRHDGEIRASNSSSPLYDGGGTAEMSPKEQCYDVYIRHPDSVRLDRMADYSIAPDLFVSEVQLSTTASNVYVKIIPDKDPYSKLIPSTQRQVIRTWTESGPLSISADGAMHYVVTVCATTASTATTSTDASHTDGGSSSSGTVATPTRTVPTLSPTTISPDPGQHDLVERAPSSAPSALQAAAPDSLGRHGMSISRRDGADPSGDRALYGHLQIRAGSQVLMVPLERADDFRTQSTLLFQRPSHSEHSSPTRSESPTLEDISKKKNATTSGKKTKTGKKADPVDARPAVMKSIPERVHFQLLSSASPDTFLTVGITNVSPYPITVMRVSAALRMSSIHQHERYGVDVTVMDLHERLGRPIVPNRTVADAISLKCTVDWNKLHPNLHNASIEFHGAIIVRGTKRTWPIDEWEAAVLDNPLVDSTIALEIPLSIKIYKGRIGLLMQGTSHPFEPLWSLSEWTTKIDQVSGAFFPFTSSDARVMISGEGMGKVAELKAMDHHLRVMSNIAIDVDLASAEIYDPQRSSDDAESLCDRFDLSLIREENADRFEVPSYHTDVGLVALTYHFYGTTNKESERYQNRTIEDMPKTCYLRVSTEPNTGIHMIPLVVYGAYLDVSAFPDNAREHRSGTTNSDQESVSWHRTMVGFDKLIEWFQTTKTGSALRAALDSSPGNRSDPEWDSILLGRYIYGLSKKSVDLEKSKLRPVLLKAGAIEQGTIETLPLYITNHNPVPISITVDVGEVEGMSISLGRDEASGAGNRNTLLDHLPETSRFGFGGVAPRIRDGRFRGHPLDGLRRFLLGDKMSASFASQFPFRDAISMSDGAVNRSPFLGRLYGMYAQGRFHRVALPSRLSPKGWSRCKQTIHPPLYGPFENKLSGRRLPGPIIVSNDSKRIRRLPVCWDQAGAEEAEDRRSQESGIVLPPGGVARFDISLRSPSSAVLEKDITQFLATGLVLSTDHGEVVPVFVSFEALQGGLEPTVIEPTRPATTGGSSGRDKVVRVPMGLFRRPTRGVKSTVTLPARDSDGAVDMLGGTIIPRSVSVGSNGVSLFMRSSFARDVRLLRVSSCNPWFEVILEQSPNSKPDHFLGSDVGSVRSIMSCGTGSSFPSFYRCTLNWLAKRSELQAHGCGSSMLESRQGDKEKIQVAERGSVERAVNALKRAARLLESEEGVFPELSFDPIALMHGGQGSTSLSLRSSRDGVVAPIAIDVMCTAWDTWKKVSELGLHRVSTSLRAHLEYNFTAEEKTARRLGSTKSVDDEAHLLSLALQNLTVESVIETPILIDVDRANRRLERASLGNDRTFSVLDFRPTLVGQVSSLSLPLRNPTAVPVRVRLSVLGRRRDGSRNDGEMEESTRSLYVKKSRPPYVQTGKRLSPSNATFDTAQHHWWDQGGSYFLSDCHGDIVRNHQKVMIRSMSGSQFNLVNPSTMHNSALLIGCQARCGLRDDSPPKNLKDLSLSSMIGAASAGGVSLIGRQRGLSTDSEKTEDRRFLAAGSLVDDGKGPPAFAIPFPALNEVIIPPFGEVEIGPVLFRPPGRSQLMGCAAQKGAESPKRCTTQQFDTMVFLENTLTGLERVVLRGKAQWEHVAFVDPVMPDEVESFGDIEQRHGRPTLVFSGGADVSKNPVPVVKEVVVHNLGDVPVSFTRMFLSTTIDFREYERDERPTSCEASDFRLLGCRAGDTSSFTLSPGQKQSLFIQHHPHCNQRKNYVTLNLEFDRGQASSSGDWVSSGAPITGMWHGMDAWLKGSRTSGVRQSRANSWKHSFQRSKLVLLLGYEMTDREFKACLPVHKAEKFLDIGTSVLEWNQTVAANYVQLCRQVKISTPTSFQVLRSVSAMVFLTIFVTVLSNAFAWRRGSSCRFRKLLAPHTRHLAGDKKPSTPSSPVGMNWSAAFRCLARADSSSSDLQTLGREQTRLVVLARYKAPGALPPQCFNGSGFPHRERSGGSGSNMNGPGRQQLPTGKMAGGTNERIRTLGDAIFGRYAANEDFDMGMLPSQAGWRTADARGVFGIDSLEKCNFQLRTKNLLLARSRRAEEVAEHSIDLSEDTFAASAGDFDCSYEEEFADQESSSAEADYGKTQFDSAANSFDIASSSNSEATDPLKNDVASCHADDVTHVSATSSETASSVLPVTKKVVKLVSKREPRHLHISQDNGSEVKAVNTQAEVPKAKVEKEGFAKKKESPKATGKSGRRHGKTQEGESKKETKRVSPEKRPERKNERSRKGKNRTERKEESNASKKTSLPPKEPPAKEEEETAPATAPPVSASSEGSTSPIRPPPGLGPPPGFGGAALAKPAHDSQLTSLTASFLTATTTSTTTTTTTVTPSGISPTLGATAPSPNLSPDDSVLMGSAVVAGASDSVGRSTPQSNDGILNFSPTTSPMLGPIGQQQQQHQHQSAATAGLPTNLLPPPSSVGHLEQQQQQQKPPPPISLSAFMAPAVKEPLSPDRPSGGGGGDENFDVMQFLDDILQDRNGVSSNILMNQNEGASMFGSPSLHGSHHHHVTSSPTLVGLSANPWATGGGGGGLGLAVGGGVGVGHQSRLSAYGIAVDDGMDGESKESGTPDGLLMEHDMLVSSNNLTLPPLVSPGGILSSVVHEEAEQDKDDEQGDKNEEDIDAREGVVCEEKDGPTVSLFYKNLLGE